VLGHGLFLREVDAAYVATAGRMERLERATSPDPQRFPRDTKEQP
jgi:hypothetical protein